jgi:NAD(P)-dependent dehydrogenase (short-subunit alcohol dehydrogenase family)
MGHDHGRVVLVTGAGSGLGRALVRALLKRGDIAIAIGRSQVTLEEAGDGLDRSRLVTAVADVRDPKSLSRIAQDTLARFGRIDGLFANAAIYPRGRIHEQDPAEALDVMAINIIGAANSIRAVFPAMMGRAHGRIVLVGSYAHAAPLPDSWAYSASKGALHSLAKAAAAEVRGDFPDILVNEWVPGALRTRMGVDSGIEPEVAAGWGLALLDLPPGGASGQLFSQDVMVEPRLSLKRRLLRKIGLA